MRKAILTAFNGKLKSDPVDMCPPNYEFYIPKPFEMIPRPHSSCLRDGEWSSFIDAGVFERTGRIVDGCVEYALTYLRKI
jgi:hypothetical protein